MSSKLLALDVTDRDSLCDVSVGVSGLSRYTSSGRTPQHLSGRMLAMRIRDQRENLRESVSACLSRRSLTADKFLELVKTE